MRLSAGIWQRGLTRVIGVESPPAGVEWFIAVPEVPEGIWWYVRGVEFRLTAGAAPALSRNVALVFDQGSGQGFLRVLTGTNIAAGLSQDFTYTENVPAVSTARGAAPVVPAIQIALPYRTMLPPGYRVRSDTIVQGGAGIGAADQYSAIRVYVEEWVYEPPGETGPNAGDGSNRVDVVKLNETLVRLSRFLERIDPC